LSLGNRRREALAHLDRVRARPGMYLPSETYACFVAYVMGYDAAWGGGLLAGFDAWLARRVDKYENSAWHAIVIGDVFGHPLTQLTTPADHKFAIQAAFERLETFWSAGETE
jgi:hypothetical protein